MSARPLVSVVLPFHDRQDVLADAIGSVLGQTMADLEVILVDDGSSDGSLDVARGFVDDRIVLVALDRNLGVCGSRNVAIERARGRYLAFQDSDDLWLPEKLRRQLDAFADHGPEVAIVGCGWTLDGRGAQTVDAGPHSRDEVLAGRVGGLATPRLLCDRERIRPEARFDPRFPALVERDYLLSALHPHQVVHVVPESLMVVRRGRSDHVATNDGAARSFGLYREKYRQDMARLPEVRSWYTIQEMRERVKTREVALAVAALRSDDVRHGLRPWIHLALGAAVGERGLAVGAAIAPLARPERAAYPPADAVGAPSAPPTISVCVPSLGRASLVTTCLPSVHRQLAEGDEVVVSLHGRDVPDLPQGPVGRVRGVRHDGGTVSANRNAALAAATGDLVVFLDDDDEMVDGALEEVRALMAAPLVAVACGAADEVGPAGVTRTLRPVPMGELHRGVTARFLAGTFAARRTVLEAVGGYDEVLEHSENHELGMRLVAHVRAHGLWIGVGERSWVRVRPSGVDYGARSVAAAERVLAVHGGELPRRSRVRADLHAIAAVQSTRLGDVAGGRRHAAAALRAWPTGPRHAARFVELTLVPPSLRARLRG